MWAIYGAQGRDLWGTGPLDVLLTSFPEFDWRLRKKDDGGIEFVGLRWDEDKYVMRTIKEYK